MKDIDTMIDQALDEEERQLLREIGEEPGFISQLLGIFGGRTGWTNALMMVVQSLLLILGIWTAWHFFAASDPVMQLRWGLPASVLLLMSLIIKMAVWPTVQTNRILHELRRIELQIARSTTR